MSINKRLSAKHATWLGALLAMFASGCVAEAGTGDESASESNVSKTTDQLYQLGTAWTSGVVNVCYDTADGNNPTLLASARNIVNATWAAQAKISFVGWGACNYANRTSPFSMVALHFAAGTNGSTSNPPGMHAATGSGSSWAPGVSHVYLTSSDPNFATRFPYEVIHELGHAIGYAHEQERPDNWTGTTPIYCNQTQGSIKSLPGGTYRTPYFDLASVMDYCNPAGFPDVLSNGDIEGIRQTYGNHILFTPGDFNGDGYTDVIITTAGGSYWYYSTGVGTWNVAYTRTDLPLNAVEYVTGDFNGDTKTDVIITTASGSYWYYSTGTGTWNNAYTRTDLPRGYVEYVPGDYNGDGKTDVIITTAGGSYWYYSTGTGTWNSSAYTRTDLPLGNVAYVPGDYDGDGKTDVIITTASGSYWYYSTGTGTWNNAYTRTDLPLGAVAYTPADYDNDGKTDVIISNAGGSYWYYSTGTGTWNNAYTRTDLPLGQALYVPGDFNGDGKSDVIITTSGGSYWYYSTGTGTWNSSAYNRTDLPLGTVAYKVGNFDGVGGKDVIITTAGGSYWYYSTGTGTWNSSAYSRGDLPL